MKTIPQLKRLGRGLILLVIALPFALTASINFLPWWVSAPLGCFIFLAWSLCCSYLSDVAKAIKEREKVDGKEA